MLLGMGMSRSLRGGRRCIVLMITDEISLDYAMRKKHGHGVIGVKCQVRCHSDLILNVNDFV